MDWDLIIFETIEIRHLISYKSYRYFLRDKLRELIEDCKSLSTLATTKQSLDLYLEQLPTQILKKSIF